MRAIIVSLMLLLSACTSIAQQTASQRVQSFYSSYLAFVTDGGVEYPPDQLREYVAADTIARLAQIDAIPEQDLINADYFAYIQDYDPSWLRALTVGDSRPFLEGEVVPVWIGVEGGKRLELEVFVRCESGEWKIYRVRDVTDNYEHPIFDAGAISWQKYAAASGL